MLRSTDASNENCWMFFLEFFFINMCLCVCVKYIKIKRTHTHTNVYIHKRIQYFSATLTAWLLKKSAPKGPARHNHPQGLTLLPLVRTYIPFRRLYRNSPRVHIHSTLFAYYICPSPTTTTHSPKTVPFLSGRLSVPRRLRTNQTACVQKLHTQSYRYTIYIYI